MALSKERYEEIKANAAAKRAQRAANEAAGITESVVSETEHKPYRFKNAKELIEFALKYEGKIKL